MKKNLVAVLTAVVVSAMTLAGCAGADAETVSNVSGAVSSAIADYNASDLVTLGEYKGLTAEATLEEVTDADVDSYINYVMSMSTNPVTDRAVQTGDTVNIDYEGKYKDSGEAFQGGTAQGSNLTIGSGQFIDGFEDGLIGANIGETRDLNLTFPENYQSADLAGKEVIFTVTVNSISEPATLNDEYVQTLGIEGVTDVDGLKAYVKEMMQSSYQSQYDSDVQNQVVEAAFNNCVFSNPPEDLVSSLTSQLNDQAGQLAQYYSSNYGTSVSVDQVMSMVMSQEGFSGTVDEYLNSSAVKEAERYIMFEAIAAAENITVTDEEVDAKLAEDMASSGASYSGVEDYKATVDVNMVRLNLIADKVSKFLQENATVVAPEVTEAASTDSSAEASTESSAEASSEASTSDASDAATSAESASDASQEASSN